MQRLIRNSAKIGLVAWAVSMLFVGGALEARHLLALPQAEPSAAAREASQLALAGSSDDVVAWHILAANCPCSRRVADHVSSRVVIPGVRDVIVWVRADGDQHPAPSEPANGSVEIMTPSALQQRFGAVAAPLMLVIDRGGLIRYSGGYSRRKQGEIEDETILRNMRSGRYVETLPIFGCAVSAELARLMDPLRLGSIVQAGK